MDPNSVAPDEDADVGDREVPIPEQVQFQQRVLHGSA